MLFLLLSTAASALQVSPLQQLAATPPAASSASRLELRDELLSLLPPSGTGPQPLEARAFEVCIPRRGNRMWRGPTADRCDLQLSVLLFPFFLVNQ